MIYLLDSNACGDLMREHPRVLAELSSVPADGRVVTCTVVRGEILYGIARLPQGKRRADLETKALKLLSALRCEPISESAADRYAEVKLSRERKGLSLDENDLWIASIALHLEAELVSRDTDFAEIEGLTVTDWTK